MSLYTVVTSTKLDFLYSLAGSLRPNGGGRPPPRPEPHFPFPGYSWSNPKSSSATFCTFWKLPLLPLRSPFSCSHSQRPPGTRVPARLQEPPPGLDAPRVTPGPPRATPPRAPTQGERGLRRALGAQDTARAAPWGPQAQSPLALLPSPHPRPLHLMLIPPPRQASGLSAVDCVTRIDRVCTGNHDTKAWVATPPARGDTGPPEAP